MLTKQNIIDRIEVFEDGRFFITEATVILEDGKEIAREHHRKGYDPGESMEAETDARLVAIRDVVWTQKVIDDFKSKREDERNAARIEAENSGPVPKEH